jgi:chromate transporter
MGRIGKKTPEENKETSKLFKSIAEKRLLRIFWIYFKIGNLAFGGPYVIIEYMRKEFVEKRQLVSEEQFSTALGVGFATPGPVAFGAGICLGHMIDGLPGALAAALGLLITPFIWAVLFAFAYARLSHASWFSHVTAGIAAGGIGVLAALVLRQIKGIAKKPDAIVLAIASCTIILVSFSPLYAIALGVAWAVSKTLLDKRKKKGEKEEPE